MNPPKYLTRNYRISIQIYDYLSKSMLNMYQFGLLIASKFTSESFLSPYLLHLWPGLVGYFPCIYTHPLHKYTLSTHYGWTIGIHNVKESSVENLKHFISSQDMFAECCLQPSGRRVSCPSLLWILKGLKTT